MAKQSAFTFVFDPQDRLFCTHEHGALGIPGGKRDEGESRDWADIAAREFREETGCDAPGSSAGSEYLEWGCGRAAVRFQFRWVTAGEAGALEAGAAAAVAPRVAAAAEPARGREVASAGPASGRADAAGSREADAAESRPADAAGSREADATESRPADAAGSREADAREGCAAGLSPRRALAATSGPRRRAAAEPAVAAMDPVISRMEWVPLEQAYGRLRPHVQAALDMFLARRAFLRAFWRPSGSAAFPKP